MKRLVLAAVAALAATGCATLGAPVGVIYTGETSPKSYYSPTNPLATAAPEVHGEACSTGILGLVAYGDSGYNAAYQAALESSGAKSLYDVKVDMKVMSILGVYQRYCAELTGRAVK